MITYSSEYSSNYAQSRKSLKFFIEKFSNKSTKDNISNFSQYSIYFSFLTVISKFSPLLKLKNNWEFT